jgi:hypothetical protein
LAIIIAGVDLTRETCVNRRVIALAACLLTSYSRYRIGVFVLSELRVCFTLLRAM